jgi:hypothetical protein
MRFTVTDLLPESKSGVATKSNFSIAK